MAFDEGMIDRGCERAVSADENGNAASGGGADAMDILASCGDEATKSSAYRAALERPHGPRRPP